MLDVATKVPYECNRSGRKSLPTLLRPFGYKRLWLVSHERPNMFYECVGPSQIVVQALDEAVAVLLRDHRLTHVLYKLNGEVLVR
jgi:hypothetical protein